MKKNIDISEIEKMLREYFDTIKIPDEISRTIETALYQKNKFNIFKRKNKN